MQNPEHPDAGAARLTSDLATIDGAFVEYLRQRHSAARTITVYRGILYQLARSFSRKGRDLSSLRRAEVARLIRRHWRGQALAPRAALHAWLKLQGRFNIPKLRLPLQDWVDDYARFMEADRGLSPFTRGSHANRVSRYLAWQFGQRAIRWDRVRPKDIWNYAAQLQRGRLKPRSVIDYLSSLRQFLRFVHLQGGCSPVLAHAVPTISNRGRSTRHDVISDDQRRKFLDSFDRKSADGYRDYTMALCMINLGLRRIEIVRLRLGDIAWERHTLAVPPAKAGRGRLLPLPRHVASALRSYVRRRPVTNNDSLFVGHAMLRGRPLSPEAVTSAIGRAYLRCGFHDWTGTHRLRHSFATRLYAHGANMKEIADLLGHRLLMTTDRYTGVDSHDLRSLVLPWPD
ncbi:MAG: tyrosine-type recombinase/integrase [Opitutaceae bacterium]|jgi:site-specific recombinase XerD